jgi:ATP-dependent DNA helicase DinG
MFDIGYNDHSIVERYITHKEINQNCNYVFTFDRKYIVFERWTGKTYAYSVLNYADDKIANIIKSKVPITKDMHSELVKKILHSKIYKFILPNEPTELIDFIFRKIFPVYGYLVRENQIKLSINMFNGMSNKSVALCEAEVGTGKTYAYIIAGIVYGLYEVKNKLNNKSYAYFNVSQRPEPIVITTSSIELQKAILNCYIPDISRMLLDYKIISGPVSGALRKGKEHYLCELRFIDLMDYLSQSSLGRDVVLYKLLSKLDLLNANIDLDVYTQLKSHITQKINVPKTCDDTCPIFNKCRYIEHLDLMKSSEHTFQVCNHNYYLADAMKRYNNRPVLIPDHSSAIIDEAHKLLQAAYQIFGQRFESSTVTEFIKTLNTLITGNKLHHQRVKEMCQELQLLNDELFGELIQKSESVNGDSETSQIKTNITIFASRKMFEMLRLLERICNVCFVYIKKSRNITRHIKDLTVLLTAFSLPKDILYWIEDVQGEKSASLCSIPTNIETLLVTVLWKNKTPKILTSGTLSDDKGFDFFKTEAGISRLPKNEISEISMPSPFDYKNNTLLYISNSVPYPDKHNRNYLNAVADEVAKLIEATHGHTVILFTSYKLLSSIYELLKNRIITFPLIKMDKGTKNAIQAFKKSQNGVLFASGAFWEGVDCPGDILSSVIIVNLPFAVPTPILEHKRNFYPKLNEFIQTIIFPEMLIKLKQGIGRLIRNETDTGLIAILDCRMSKNGKYQNRILKALADYTVTYSIDDVKTFFIQRKNERYFLAQIMDAG